MKQEIVNFSQDIDHKLTENDKEIQEQKNGHN